MGNGINGQMPSNWNPQNVINQWRNFCSSMMPLDSIMAFTLWQGGPPQFNGTPWMNTSTSIWNNASFGGMAPTWGSWDSFVPTVASKTTNTETSTQTQEEKDKAEFEKEQLGKKMDKLKKILNDYKATLDSNVEADYLIIKNIERAVNNSNVTQENYDKLLEIFNTNNIESSLKDKTLKSMLVSEDTSFKNKVSKDCWTKKNWSAQLRVTEDNVLEYMATFNNISKGNFVGTLFNRTNDKGSDNKKTNERSKIVEHLNDIQKSLIAVAQNICDNSDISDDSKQNLQKSIDTLKGSKPDEALYASNYKDYEKKLAELFNLTRAAKLESVEKEYEFLGISFSDDEKKKLEDTKM